MRRGAGLSSRPSAGGPRFLTLIYVYLFALILGGVLLGASILLGGKDFDADVDVDADADADAGGHAIDKDVVLDGGDIGFFLWTFRSIRFWTFFLAFFGVTGLILRGLELVDSDWVGLGLALGMGAASGLGAAGAIRWLSQDESGAAASSRDYIGKSARVLVPVKKSGLGKVRVRIKGHTVDVLAVTDDESIGKGEEALIIEMDGEKARIARVDTKD